MLNYFNKKKKKEEKDRFVIGGSLICKGAEGQGQQLCK